MIRSIKDQHGEETVRQLVADAGDATAAVFQGRIRGPGWYPYPAFAAFLHAAERRLGKPNRSVCRELGALGGQRDLGTVFRVFAALASPERLIRGCHKIWPTYYRGAGRMEAIEWAPERTVLRIFGFSEMHPSHCRLMEGWMISTMAAIGCRVNDDARESECTSQGGACHEFVCSWTRS